MQAIERPHHDAKDDEWKTEKRAAMNTAPRLIVGHGDQQDSRRRLETIARQDSRCMLESIARSVVPKVKKTPAYEQTSACWDGCTRGLVAITASVVDCRRRRCPTWPILKRTNGRS
jgi:hypothetical protein